MDSPCSRRKFYALNYTCLRILRTVSNNLIQNLNFSLDGSDIDLEKTLLRVNSLSKIERSLEELKEVTCCMLFEEDCKLFTIISIILIAFQKTLTGMLELDKGIINKNVQLFIKLSKKLLKLMQELFFVE